MKNCRYILAAIALMSLCACYKDDMRLDGFANDPDAVHIVVAAGGIQTRSNPIEEDGADPTKFNKGDKITVNSDYQDDVVYVFDGTAWTPEAEGYLKWYGNVQKFSAFYPSRHTNTVLDQSTLSALQTADIMSVYDSEQTINSERSIFLKLRRETARIVISKTVDWGTLYGSGYSITDLRIHSQEDAFVYKPYSGKENYYALLYRNPRERPDKTFLTIKIKKSGDLNAKEITHSITGIPVLEEGKSYQFELKIGKDKAEISCITVENWESGDVIKDGGEAIEAPDYSTSAVNGVTTYHVYTAKGLQDVNAIMTASSVTKETLASNIKLEGNIILPAVAEDESNWTAIGVYAVDEKGNTKIDLGYTGTFDGNGYTLTGLVINSENNYQALLGYLDAGGVVKNLTLANCSIKGGSYTGAFVGWSANSSIENCRLIATKDNEVRIESESLYLGGIVGQSFGTVSGCTLTADGGSVTITSTDDHVGGIVGNAGRDSYTSGCQVLALNGGTIAITGDERTGGIVGDVVNGDNAEMMSDCHITNNDGTITVTGTTDVGGAAGYIHSISNSFVQNCNVTGVQVTGTAQVGGFTGRLNDESTIVGSNTVKNCTVTGTDAETVKWDVGKNENTSHTPEITDGGENKVTILTE